MTTHSAQPTLSPAGNGTPERGRMTEDQLQALAEATARALLGVSATEAFSRLDRGELDGTLAGGALRSLRWLLRA